MSFGEILYVARGMFMRRAESFDTYKKFSARDAGAVR